MSSDRIRLTASWLLLGAVAAPGLAQVVSWEGTYLPEAEGRGRTALCTPESWIEGTWFQQALAAGECGAPPGVDRDSYRRSRGPFNGVAQFLLEFRVQTDGERSEIPGGAPTVVAMGHFAGEET